MSEALERIIAETSRREKAPPPLGPRTAAVNSAVRAVWACDAPADERIAALMEIRDVADRCIERIEKHEH